MDRNICKNEWGDLSVRSSFIREAMVRGYHIYNSIWEAYIGEELLCQQDEEN